MSVRTTLFLAVLLVAFPLSGCTKVSGSGGGASAVHPWTQPGVFRWSAG